MKLAELFDIKDQVVLVTGGASGIGLGYCEILAEAGARVIMSDIDHDALTRESARLRSEGFEVEPLPLDVTDSAALDAAVASIVAAHGTLDTVFINAGIGGGLGFVRPGGALEDSDVDHFDRVMAMNMRTVFQSMRAVSATMKRQKHGRIIVTGSYAGLRSSPDMSYSYVASKTAVTGLVRQAALEFAPFNVLVNGIAPGPITTNISGGRLKNDQGIRARTVVNVPLGRIGEPDDLKGLALLLASPASGFITGALISVDGGKSAT
ncbi:SDR family NAD(P)-dependent oxidoreductase [Pararobbsia silviterrae]|uniref:SDR family oxidoreductase n=1 Tax=Pararobbsia silviterrae TaxID=1792498 RepID=A0A494Y6Q2_9BURK|nr:SDR family NAD(P)-dependent oxidoreductase [Pararobbsia silviterrae]RKP57752.1 SDR family oxidoreductase [Pararobbsia silviterrae]